MHQRKCITSGASPLLYHPWCITSCLLPAGAEHHAAALHPAHLGGLHTLILSYSHTVTLSHPLLHPQDSVALIIALNLKDGHRPNLLVPLTNHLILKSYNLHQIRYFISVIRHISLISYRSLWQTFVIFRKHK